MLKSWWVRSIVGLSILGVVAAGLGYWLAGSFHTVSAPEGLQAKASVGVVEISWNSVEGADQYMLVRDDGEVIYAGDETRYSDFSAKFGERRYVVISTVDGRESPASAETVVKVDSGWGDWGSYAAEFPKLLPRTPKQVGWQQSTCQWMIRPDRAELGSGPQGSGHPVGRARIACMSPDSVALQVVWVASAEEVDEFFGRASAFDGAEAISWRYGTGYVRIQAGEIYIRADDRNDVFFAIGKSGATKSELIRLANSMDLD
ncbi:MAG: hypothetical protein WBG39_03130 [Gordonia sp. (in: high G+C Gram-positive bacteria)]